MSCVFKYELPDGGLKTRSYLDEEGKIKFDPAVYEQRYSTTLRILKDPRWNQKFKKVADFGCAEMRFLPLLRRIETIEHILEIDIDQELLERYKCRAKPLLADHLNKRENPLRIEVLQGSITAAVEPLRNVDAVIGLEIIEHLHAETLDHVPVNIFGFVRPKIAIFSTPNSEFNVLFQPLLENGFRHLDHKFEWTRAELKQWALDICKRYPDYSVAFMGVGKPPPDYKRIGYVSQFAIFARNDLLGRQLKSGSEVPMDSNPDPAVQYKQIDEVDFPFYRDERTRKEKIRDEAVYIITTRHYTEKYFNYERFVYELPLKMVLDHVNEKKLNSSKAELMEVLAEEKYKVENEHIVLPDEQHQCDDDFDDLGIEDEDNPYENDKQDNSFREASPLDAECWDDG